MGDEPAGGPVAVAVKGDRIVWVGSPEELPHAVEAVQDAGAACDAKAAGCARFAEGVEAAEAVGLAGDVGAGEASLPVLEFPEGFLMPGFHDAHIHVFHSALYRSDLAERYCGTIEADAFAASSRPLRLLY